MQLYSQQRFLSANTVVKGTKGTLYFKKVADLNSTKGKYASYNNDRIVFYENDYTGKDFVAYVRSILYLYLTFIDF